MSGYRFYIIIVFLLVSLYPIEAVSQQITKRERDFGNDSSKVNFKPVIQYSVGSTFMIISHQGTVSGFTLSPSLMVPLSSKLSVSGGIIAGRYYSTLKNYNAEGLMSGSFSALSVYGSASYRVNSRLTLYGSGIKQLTNTSSFYSLPKSSYTIGSTYNFGNFSVGLTLHMSNWNYNSGAFPFTGTQGFNSPFDQR